MEATLLGLCFRSPFHPKISCHSLSLPLFIKGSFLLLPPCVCVLTLHASVCLLAVVARHSCGAGPESNRRRPRKKGAPFLSLFPAAHKHSWRYVDPGRPPERDRCAASGRRRRAGTRHAASLGTGARSPYITVRCVVPPLQSTPGQARIGLPDAEVIGTGVFGWPLTVLHTANAGYSAGLRASSLVCRAV